MASSGAAGVRSAVSCGRVLLVVERPSIRGGNLPRPGPLGFGEHLLLDLEVGPGVVIVELGEGIRSVRLGWRAPGSMATSAPSRRGGRGLRRRGRPSGARRGKPGPERLVLARERIVAPDECLHLRGRQGEVFAMKKDGSDRRARKLGLLLGGRVNRGRRTRRCRRGAGHRHGSEGNENAHLAQNTAATSGLWAGKVSAMSRPLRLLAAGCILALLHSTPARA
jgi:hypothetical protein